MIEPLAQPVAQAIPTGDAQALSVLRPGQVVEARVDAAHGDGTVRLAIGNAAIEVRLAAPVEPGQTLLLQVLRGGSGLAFSLLAGAAAAPPPASSATTPAAIAPQPKLVQLPPGAAAPRDTGVTVTATQARGLGDVRPGQVIEARVDVRHRDGSVRFTSGTASFEAVLPGPARPGHTLLLQAIRSTGNPTFAVLASGTTAAPPAAVPAGTPPPLPADAAQVLRSAAATQDTATALLGTLTRLTAEPGRAVPQPVRDIVTQLLGLRLPGDGTLDGAALRSAVASSGIFFEASLARGAGAAASGDMKAVLLALQAALRAWTGGGEAARAASATSAPPPRRGALPQVPGATAPADLAAMGEAELARGLLAHTSGALARLRLAQAASLADPAELARAGADRPAAEWTFELPFTADGRSVMVQFRLERDASGEHAHDAPGWRLRFAIDAGAPVGIVHALVGFAGGEVSVTLWAESDAGARLLREEMDDLGEALGTADLAVGALAIHCGRPRAPAEPSGGFVDRRT